MTRALLFKSQIQLWNEEGRKGPRRNGEEDEEEEEKRKSSYLATET